MEDFDDLSFLDEEEGEKASDSPSEPQTPPTSEANEEPAEPTSEVEEVEAVEEESANPLREDIPQVVGEIASKEYMAVVSRVQQQYSFLPILDYNAIYSELANLSVETSPAPSLQVINDELAKVQGCKERLATIHMDVTRAYNFKKRAVDILMDAWSKFSVEKSADKRKSDAVYRLSQFAVDLANTESLYKASLHVLNNLAAAQDTLSRRITIYQLQIKLQDIGRGGLPDFDFATGKKVANMDEAEKALANIEDNSCSPFAVDTDGPSDDTKAESAELDLTTF